MTQVGEGVLYGELTPQQAQSFILMQDCLRTRHIESCHLLAKQMTVNTNCTSPLCRLRHHHHHQQQTQYHHLHILVSRGLSALDAVFDGRFVPALQQAGCVISDVVTNFSSYHPAAGRWAQPTVAAKGALLIVQATRHTVEGVTRQLLDGTRGVEVTYGTTVTGLVMDQQQQQQQEDDKVEHRPAHQPHVMQEASGGPHQRVTGERRWLQLYGSVCVFVIEHTGKCEGGC